MSFFFVDQVEYAAEMAIEHHLGMTCDPVEGLVQVPCIERCGFATLRALDCADYALMSDGRHLVSYDEVVLTLKLTGFNSPFFFFLIPAFLPFSTSKRIPPISVSTLDFFSKPIFFVFFFFLGEDIREAYRETAGGGLAKTYKLEEDLKAMKSDELTSLRENAKKQAMNCSTCGSSTPCASENKREEKEIF